MFSISNIIKHGFSVGLVLSMADKSILSPIIFKKGCSYMFLFVKSN